MNLFAVAGLMKLRRTLPDAARPFRTPLYPLTPLVFAALSSWMTLFVIWQRPSVILAALGTLLVGGALHAWLERGVR
jgi:amino acid transporter